MMKNLKAFITGAFTMFILLAGFYIIMLDPKEEVKPSQTEPVKPTIQADSVTITPLPSLRIIRGEDVAFEGKTELKQLIAGSFAQKITIVNFHATGENAQKSYIKILWENGEVQKMYPGTVNMELLPDKRAVEITVVGYSVRERHIFRNSNRKGTLAWEIRYEPVEDSK